VCASARPPAIALGADHEVSCVLFDQEVALG
jgi:hypothetical protein